jgi:hypothetical protein
MSVSETLDLMERYFGAMGRGEDFSIFYDEGVSWLMVDSGQLVSGGPAVRDYVVELHAKMTGGEAREMVVADGHVYLEGSSFNASPEHEDGLSYCLVYDVTGDRITAARCYGALATLLAAD